MNQTMKQYDTLFKRYWDEAEYYAHLYGFDPKMTPSALGMHSGTPMRMPQ
jgi:hypothetical protein